MEKRRLETYHRTLHKGWLGTAISWLETRDTPDDQLLEKPLQDVIIALDALRAVLAERMRDKARWSELHRMELFQLNERIVRATAFILAFRRL